MSEAQHELFETRVRRITRTHSRLSRGYRTRVTRTGLIVAEPQAVKLNFPWRGMMMAVGLTLAVKTGLLVWAGPEDYAARIEGMRQGGPAERAASWMLGADPVTLKLADIVGDTLDGTPGGRSNRDAG